MPSRLRLVFSSIEIPFSYWLNKVIPLSDVRYSSKPICATVVEPPSPTLIPGFIKLIARLNASSLLETKATSIPFFSNAFLSASIRYYPCVNLDI